MRPLNLLLALLCGLVLTACGTEDELAPPTFSNIMVNGSATTSIPFKDPNVIITGNIDDFSATLVSGEVQIGVNSNDGSWIFPITLSVGSNTVTLTASDVRGNSNQLSLTLVHDPAAPLVTSVTQSLDPAPHLIITFDETLADLQSTAVFAVDGTSVPGATFDTVLTRRIFTLPLSAALQPGSHQLSCDGVVDLAGNSVPVGYTSDFKIE